MRTVFVGMIAVLALALSLHAAEKNSQAAAATRKKLQVKITVDFKDETFEDILKEIKKQIEDVNAGSLSWTREAGVSGNTKYSYAAKDQTVADVLDGIFKKNSLGYIVVSKAGDRYDGWLKIKQGNERGYAAGEEPKDAKAPPKSVPKDKAKEAEKSESKSANDDDKAEKAAQGKLDLARELIKDGKKDRAKQRLNELIKQYPNTKAAGEAKKELEKLGG